MILSNKGARVKRGKNKKKKSSTGQISFPKSKLKEGLISQMGPGKPTMLEPRKQGVAAKINNF